MNVVMINQTHYKGKTLRVGDIVAISDSVAERWVDRNIAQVTDEEVATISLVDPIVTPEESNTDQTGASGKYTGMKAKELYALCKERNIEAEARQSDEHYVALLESADKAAE